MERRKKPIKISKQRNETFEDVVEIIEDTFKLVNISNGKNLEIVSNMITNSNELINNPQNIAAQLIDSQEDTAIKGKMIYSVQYTFLKDFSIDDAKKLVNKTLDHYPDFQAIGAIDGNGEKTSVMIVFNNFSIDGTKKMTKEFRPQKITNEYYKIKKEG